MDVLLYLLGILVVVIGIAVSIGLHEVGHLLPAKLFGVKVTQYMIGFGKTLFSRIKGETEYGVKAIPLGGYVAMIGMYPPGNPGDQARPATTGFLQSLTNDAREASADTIGEGEDDRTFYRLATWKKIVIMLGGPIMNLVLAFVFFGVLLSGVGVPTNTTTVSSVSECLVAANADAPAGTATCDANSAPSPAAAAGVLPGDTLVSLAGTPITDWNDFRDRVAAHPGERLDLIVSRGGEQHTLAITPAVNERIVVDALGRAERNEDGSPRTETVGMVGLSPDMEMRRRSLAEVPQYVGANIEAVTNVVLHLPQRMVDVWQAAFGVESRDPDGPISVVGVGRIAGEITSLEDTPVREKTAALLSLLAGLNVALFVFNLIPLMPLDGGHIAGALYERIKRSLAKLFGRPDPGPVDTAKMVPVTFAVVVVLGAMTLLLVYADLVKPVSLLGE